MKISLAFPLAFLLLAACSSSSGSGGGADAGPPLSGEPLRNGAFPYGMIVVTMGAPDASGKSIYAYDIAFSAANPGFTCTMKSFGACVISNCEGTQETLTQSTASAGEIDLEGGATPIAIKPAYGGYDVPAGVPFRGGETLTFHAAGADVPAFDATLTAPSAITMTSVPKDGEAVDKSKPIVLAWTGGAEGFVRFNFDTMPDERVTCIVPAKDGQMTVPPELLAALTGTSAAAHLEHYTRTRVTPDGWTIDVEAVTLPAPGTMWTFTLR